MVTKISKIKKIVLDKVRSPKFITSTIFLAIFTAINWYLNLSDKHREAVETYIRNDINVVQKVGTVKILKLIRTTFVGIKRTDKNAYTEYSYIVKGKTSRVRVVAILFIQDGIFRIKIKSIKDVW